MSLRNIAIIAHVDHGKTTLVDALLQQSGSLEAHQTLDTRAMDSNDLEKERGITILAKCTSILWEKTRINIIDTPGHADFGGEVERILSMVDGVVLLVDSAEGPLPQTKFVLGKALKLGLNPILIINKIDRSDSRPDEVHNETFDLFAALNANDEQLDFPTLFASGRDGWAVSDLESEKRDNLTPLFELIIHHVPPPKVEKNGEFKLLVTLLEADPYLGRILTGRIESGSIQLNMPIKAISNDGTLIEQGRATKILAFRGLKRQSIETAEAGDIIALAGLIKGTVSNTICALSVTEPLPALPIDPPTISMTFSVNDSPLAGKEGKKITNRTIAERLFKEAEGNISIHIEQSQDKDSFVVAGRGELQLAVLIETMRREGFEISISRPRVVFQKNPETGENLEPYEEVVIDLDEEFSGIVIEKMSNRKGDLKELNPSGQGKLRLVFIVPSRGLIGYLSELLTDTRGTAVMNRLFHSYGAYKGKMEGRRQGVLISNGAGQAVAYALFQLTDRGTQFITAGTEVYEGMIIGEHTRSNDLDVNPLKGKKLTNMRASGKDDAILLPPPRAITLEDALSYIQDDELIEVTPLHIRLRKKYLSPAERKKYDRKP